MSSRPRRFNPFAATPPPPLAHRTIVIWNFKRLPRCCHSNCGCRIRNPQLRYTVVILISHLTRVSQWPSPSPTARILESFTSNTPSIGRSSPPDASRSLANFQKKRKILELINFLVRRLTQPHLTLGDCGFGKRRLP